MSPYRGQFCPGSSILPAPNCYSQGGVAQLGSQPGGGRGGGKTKKNKQMSKEAAGMPYAPAKSPRKGTALGCQRSL